MINALHLLWIIPLSIFVGVTGLVCLALCVASSYDEDEEKEYSCLLTDD